MQSVFLLFKQFKRFGYLLKLHAVRGLYEHRIALIYKLRQLRYELSIVIKMKCGYAIGGAACVFGHFADA